MSVEVPGVRLGHALGRGAFGAVYAGRHLALDVDVAVKLLPAERADAESALREARLMARLDHPNLLRVYDAGRCEGGLYLVLEMMDSSLEGVHELPPADLLPLARQLLAGLQALHEARVIHRDIKPANCLVRRRDGRVKLADLGIAIEQATHTEGLRELAGTLAFMAPELFGETARFSPRSDLYALGMTLAALALPEPPYPTHLSRHGFLQWIVNGERPVVAQRRPDLPAVVPRLIDRLMAVDPEARPHAAAEALAALADVRATAETARRSALEGAIGPWVLGAEMYASTNWISHAVTHARTGVAARLWHLQGGGPLRRSTDLILASAERASALDHPAVLPVIDWGVHEGRAYVVTGPRGQTLEEVVLGGGPFAEVEALRLAASLADAVSYLHDHRLVYQMVEPGATHMAADARRAQLAWPIYCVPAGTPAVGEQSQRVLRPRHAAPEALSGRGTVELAVDIYGLGEILFWLLAGRAAFDQPHIAECAHEKEKGPPDLRAITPDVTRPTAGLVARLLSPDPSRRPADAGAIAAEIRRIAGRLDGGESDAP